MDSLHDSVKSCLYSCSFTLCKTYTYLWQFYNKYFGDCIHYYTNNDIDLSQPFYTYNAEQFFINTLVTTDGSVLSTMNQSSNYILCDFSFLNITITFKNKEYQIE